MRFERFSIEEVIMGKPHFVNIKSNKAKMTTIKKQAGIRVINSLQNNNEQTGNMARRQAPSIIPVTIIVVVRMVGAASG